MSLPTFNETSDTSRCTEIKFVLIIVFETTGILQSRTQKGESIGLKPHIAMNVVAISQKQPCYCNNINTIKIFYSFLFFPLICRLSYVVIQHQSGPFKSKVTAVLFTWYFSCSSIQVLSMLCSFLNFSQRL